VSSRLTSQSARQPEPKIPVRTTRNASQQTWSQLTARIRVRRRTTSRSAEIQWLPLHRRLAIHVGKVHAREFWPNQASGRDQDVHREGLGSRPAARAYFNAEATAVLGYTSNGSWVLSLYGREHISHLSVAFLLVSARVFRIFMVALMALDFYYSTMYYYN